MPLSRCSRKVYKSTWNTIKCRKSKFKHTPSTPCMQNIEHKRHILQTDKHTIIHAINEIYCETIVLLQCNYKWYRSKNNILYNNTNLSINQTVNCYQWNICIYHDAFHLTKLYIKSEIQQKNHQTKNAHPILNLFFLIL